MRQLQRCGLDLTIVPGESLTTTPSDFARLFPATGGALYGRASHGPIATFLRPDARTVVKGLYFAGGSAHPGPGVPMAALSGRLAARSLLSDRVLIKGWSRGAILWWYADGVSDDGAFGFSIIWFIGSVFSPYYHWAGRREPNNHVAVNIALYGRGSRRWTMTERPSGALRQERSEPFHRQEPSYARG